MRSAARRIMSAMPPAQPPLGLLSGVRVVEYGRNITAPFAGKMLADLGADVIKVEPPEGDPGTFARPLPRRRTGL